jgi:y4mF family transcriptional regulator
MLLRKASDLGPLLREERKQKRWSQQQLGEAVGVSRQWVSMVENGKTSVEFDLAVSALAALGIPVYLGTPSIAPAVPDFAARTPLTRSGKAL